MATAAEATPGQTLSYSVLKEGQPIGREIVTVAQDGDRTTVEVTTETKVKVLFLDFHYHHRRTETWAGGQLQHFVADTDDDGAIHHLDAQRDGGVVKAVVDGKAQTLPAEALPLTLWGKAILGHDSLYSVIDAQPYKVSVKDLGAEQVKLVGKTVQTEHYHMAGDVERDLWYGPDGYLVKVAFERRGFPIEFVRE